MIHYRQDFWISFRILLHARGSAVPYALPRALASGTLCFAFMHWNVIDSSVRGGNIMWHPTCFLIFLQIATYTLAFHTNQAYNRYWEARTQVQQMASFWGDAASQVIAFDEASEADEPEGPLWRANMVHLISLLHAVCIQYLLHQNGMGTQLQVLGGIDMEESELLTHCNDQPYLVMHWITQQVSIRHMTGHLSVPAPILSRSWQVLSLGMLAYNQACKIEDTPFPFPYVQLLHLMDLLMTVFTPFVIASWMSNKVFAVILTMMGVGAFHAMFSAACIMETPFGTRSNDLPLIELHRDFVNRLKSIVDRKVSHFLNSMVQSRNHDKSPSDNQQPPALIINEKSPIFKKPKLSHLSLPAPSTFFSFNTNHIKKEQSKTESQRRLSRTFPDSTTPFKGAPHYSGKSLHPTNGSTNESANVSPEKYRSDSVEMTPANEGRVSGYQMSPGLQSMQDPPIGMVGPSFLASEASHASDVYPKFKVDDPSGILTKPRQSRGSYACSESGVDHIDHHDARSDISCFSDTHSLKFNPILHQKSLPCSDIRTRNNSARYFDRELLKKSCWRSWRDTPNNKISSTQELPLTASRRIGSDAKSPLNIARFFKVSKNTRSSDFLAP